MGRETLPRLPAPAGMARAASTIEAGVRRTRMAAERGGGDRRSRVRAVASRTDRRLANPGRQPRAGIGSPDRWALRRSTRTKIPAVSGLRAREEAATLGVVGLAAGHRTGVGAHQRHHRARLGDRGTAAPAGAAPPRSALVAFAGARGRKRADQ